MLFQHIVSAHRYKEPEQLFYSFSTYLKSKTVLIPILLNAILRDLNPVAIEWFVEVAGVIMSNMFAVLTVRLYPLIIRTTNAAFALYEISNNKLYENETAYIE